MDNQSNDLILEKHVGFIATYGKSHDVYVTDIFF